MRGSVGSRSPKHRVFPLLQHPAPRGSTGRCVPVTQPRSGGTHVSCEHRCSDRRQGHVEPWLSPGGTASPGLNVFGIQMPSGFKTCFFRSSKPQGLTLSALFHRQRVENLLASSSMHSWGWQSPHPPLPPALAFLGNNLLSRDAPHPRGMMAAP